MTKKYETRYSRREFVNLPGHHSAGFILAYVEDTGDRPIGADFRYGGMEPRVILEFGDCSDKVEFELDLSTENQCANSMHKLDTMIEVLTGMRAAVEAEAGLMGIREPRIEAVRSRINGIFSNKEAEDKTGFSSAHKLYEKCEGYTLDELEDYVNELEGIMEG